MNFEENWKIISEDEKLNEGGQGQVFKVIPLKEDEAYIYRLSDFIKSSSAMNINNVRKKFPNFISDLNRFQRLLEHPYALKKLHNIDDSQELEKAKKRLKTEIEILGKFSHPNLIKIVDYSIDDTWYVMEKFYLKGNLSSQTKYKNNIKLTLNDFLELLNSIKLLHQNGVIHRDIKPDNIFIDEDDKLVLGDFGIIFFEDKQHTRITDTYENVGSRDWQPPWAASLRIDEVKPSFDVFCLGKVLWSMLSGKRKLPYCDFNKPGYDLTKLFPDNRDMSSINDLLNRCITRDDEDNIKDANELQGEIKKIYKTMDSTLMENPKVGQLKCRRCYTGIYKKLNGRDKANIGLGIKLLDDIEVLLCETCGHIDIFHK